MARRRRLEPPSGADLAHIRAAAAADPSARPALNVLSAAPIAQIAADSVDAQRREIDALRAAAEKGREALDRLGEIETHGLAVIEAPLDAIDVDYLCRDRLPATGEDEGWRALKASIQSHGQRMPVDLAALDEGPARYGLISGYRRLSVMRRLHEETRDVRWTRVRALVRSPATLGQAFLGMVEENEIREGLSYFERGRICLRAAEQGAFPTVEAALETLFDAASPAKRSKIRSFILLVEELGDLLAHPRFIGERLGLRLAQAVRAGQGGALRRMLGEYGGGPLDADAEQALLKRCLKHLSAEGSDARSSPRRRMATLLGGATVELRATRSGAVFSVSNMALSDELLDEALRALCDALSLNRDVGR